MKKQYLYIIIAIVIIIGAVICGVKGFNIELQYSNRQEMILSSSTELDISKIEEISKSILENKEVKVQKVERFGNAVEIVSNEISNEEKENIIKKINEECNADISNDDIKIVDIPNTRIRDILKPYILPGIVTFAAVLLYFIIMYHKIGLNKVLLKGILLPIIVEMLYYSIIAITRVPFGRIVNSIAIGLYIISVGALAIYFQNEKEKLPKNDKKEND
jgi:hypothetical protein